MNWWVGYNQHSFSAKAVDNCSDDKTVSATSVNDFKNRLIQCDMRVGSYTCNYISLTYSVTLVQKWRTEI